MKKIILFMLLAGNLYGEVALYRNKFKDGTLHKNIQKTEHNGKIGWKINNFYVMTDKDSFHRQLLMSGLMQEWYVMKKGKNSFLIVMNKVYCVTADEKLIFYDDFQDCLTWVFWIKLLEK